MKLQTLVAIMWGIICLGPRVEGQDLSEVEKQIASDNSHHFAGIKDLSYTVEGTSVLSSNFAKFTGESVTDTTWGFVWKYVRSGSKFRIDTKMYDSAHRETSGSTVSFDGSQFDRLESDGTLRITKKIPKDLSELTLDAGIMKSALFTPFWFVRPAALSSLYHVDHPGDYEYVDLFQEFLSRARCSANDLANSHTITFEAPFRFLKSQLPTWNIPDHYSVAVTFSKVGQSFYPTAWKISSKERGVLLQYEIQELGNDVTLGTTLFPYPKRAVLKNFGRPNNKKSSYPTSIQDTTFVVKNLEVNPAKSLEQQCMIDPAEARAIANEDTMTFITVPR